MLCWMATSAWADEPFKAGEDYRVLDQPGATENPSTVEVREFFWFGCPHCFELEPTLRIWQKNLPAGVTFIRTAPALNDGWKPHAHAFYIAESTGNGEEISEALFDTMHVKKQFLKTEDELAKFFTRFGMSEKEFHEKYNSFAIRTNVNKARNLAMSYKLTGVPAIIVNGKYFVDMGTAKGPDRLIQVVNYLIAKEKAALKPAA
ncbi:Thiol:disulfide interchange protein, periplasmic [gamma proteobacterium HdN1]|nr:Thiol:disulfide interchange protein, periplasmic [gamma proteobacterium HdN1]